MPAWRSRFPVLLLLWLGLTGVAVAGPPPIIALIIDDLGERLSDGLRIARLPGAVACAILPHSDHGRRIAEVCHGHNKEVMLHLPMESVAGRYLGPGALTLDMTRQEMIQALERDLAAVPHVRGINNHMGSLLTRHPGHMLWLMQQLNRQGDLFFVDSRTSEQSIAYRVAGEQRIPRARRDIFLDNRPERAAIRAQFRALVRLAQRQGSALGIGHPYPETAQVLAQELPRLQRAGVRLVAVSELIARQHKESQKWQASWSR